MNRVTIFMYARVMLQYGQLKNNSMSYRVLGCCVQILTYCHAEMTTKQGRTNKKLTMRRGEKKLDYISSYLLFCVYGLTRCILTAIFLGYLLRQFNRKLKRIYIFLHTFYGKAIWRYFFGHFLVGIGGERNI